MQPRILILRAPGTNCDVETSYAFQRAGGQPEILHVRRVLESPSRLDDFQVLCVPGGFSYGDDIASGRIFGVQLQHHLSDAMQKFKSAGKLILGICNGFQALVKCGLLDESDPKDVPPATLAWNLSGKFEHRWVKLGVDGNKCVFLAGIEKMYVPVKHGEGRFVARDESALAKLQREGRLPLRYLPLHNGDAASEKIAFDQFVPYPDNPNGAQANVAGMCDATGHVFGLMPHPELHIDPTQHPRWTRGEAGDFGDGLRLFQNAVQFFR
ncbi:MAG TPA: phosphoribosylformylglycinamidine synthase subunit PurQ [Pirellulales bacterium]